MSVLIYQYLGSYCETPKLCLQGTKSLIPWSTSLFLECRQPLTTVLKKPSPMQSLTWSAKYPYWKRDSRYPISTLMGHFWVAFHHINEARVREEKKISRSGKSQGNLHQVREILNSSLKSVKSQGILFSGCHKLWLWFFLWTKGNVLSKNIH